MGFRANVNQNYFHSKSKYIFQRIHQKFNIHSNPKLVKEGLLEDKCSETFTSLIVAALTFRISSTPKALSVFPIVILISI